MIAKITRILGNAATGVAEWIQAIRSFHFLIRPKRISTSFADQDLLAFGTIDFNVRLIGADMSLAAARAK